MELGVEGATGAEDREALPHLGKRLRITAGVTRSASSISARPSMPSAVPSSVTVVRSLGMGACSDGRLWRPGDSVSQVGDPLSSSRRENRLVRGGMEDRLQVARRYHGVSAWTWAGLGMGSLDGKVALVTGGACGIGRGMATALAKAGAGATITDVRDELLAETARELCDQGLDVLDVVADGAQRRRRGPCGLSNGGEVRPHGRLDQQRGDSGHGGAPRRADGRGCGGRHGLGLLRLVPVHEGRCFPTRRSRRERSWLRLQAGLLGNTGEIGYNAAKEAIRALTRTGAREWARHNITVNCIIPGMATEGAKEFFAANPEHYKHSLANIPLGRFGDPEHDAGSLVVFLASPGAHYFTGETFNLDGGRCLRP